MNFPVEVQPNARGQILMIRDGRELIPSHANQSTSIGAANERCLALTLPIRQGLPPLTVLSRNSSCGFTHVMMACLPFFAKPSLLPREKRNQTP
jgi:hypothetical protein